MTKLHLSNIKLTVRLASAAAFMLLGVVAAPAAGFEGMWSVLIITESGACDAAYRYPVLVENGLVHYQGDAGISISGTVDDKGIVKVVVARGSQRADGSGRLSATAGAGTWAGNSSTDRCHGRWQAERR